MPCAQFQGLILAFLSAVQGLQPGTLRILAESTCLTHPRWDASLHCNLTQKSLGICAEQLCWMPRLASWERYLSGRLLLPQRSPLLRLLSNRELLQGRFL